GLSRADGSPEGVGRDDLRHRRAGAPVSIDESAAADDAAADCRRHGWAGILSNFDQAAGRDVREGPRRSPRAIHAPVRLDEYQDGRRMAKGGDQGPAEKSSHPRTPRLLRSVQAAAIS